MLDYDASFELQKAEKTIWGNTFYRFIQLLKELSLHLPNTNFSVGIISHSSSKLACSQF